MFINTLPKIYQKFTGINRMGLIAPWSEAFLEPQKKKKYYLMFISQFPKI